MKKGIAATIKFSFDNASGELIIGDRNGEYNGMVKSRIFNVIWIDKDHPFPFDPEIKPQASVTYDGKRIVVSRLN